MGAPYAYHACPGEPGLHSASELVALGGQAQQF